jgi:hypothetical protein
MVLINLPGFLNIDPSAVFSATCTRITDDEIGAGAEMIRNKINKKLSLSAKYFGFLNSGSRCQRYIYIFILYYDDCYKPGSSVSFRFCSVY